MGAILIISIIGHHEKIRFNDIIQRLDGISPKTLADVLKDLRKENLIHRESFAEIPQRVEYSLTEDGKQLCEAVLPLIRLAEKQDTIEKHRCRGLCHEEGEGSKKVGVSRVMLWVNQIIRLQNWHGISIIRNLKNTHD